MKCALDLTLANRMIFASLAAKELARQQGYTCDLEQHQAIRQDLAIMDVVPASQRQRCLSWDDAVERLA